MAAWVALLGCTGVAGGGTGGTGSVSGATGDPTQPVQLGAGVSDLPITQLTLYQGVAVDLMLDGAVVDAPQASIVAGRDALVRAFYDATDFDTRTIQGLLEVTHGGDTNSYESLIEPSETSMPGVLDSTFTFEVAAADMEPGTSLRLTLHEVDGDIVGGSDGLVWDTSVDGELTVEVGGLLDVVLLPVEYNFDGSGRLPDTSAEQLALYTEMLQGMYPAEVVTVSVGDALPWDERIDGNGNGWSELLTEVADFRSRADVPESTYYYAVFAPEPTLADFCGGGCVLGLSNLAYSPNDTWARSSVGIGYSGKSSAETMVHEVGHAHGREHAPCGLYGQPSDPGYPHDGAEIGVWGYDIVNGVLLRPTDTLDMMSYCSPIWVSDYTYQALFQRIAALAPGALSVGDVRPMQLARVTPEGDVVVGGTFVQRGTPGGRPAWVDVTDGLGMTQRVRGWSSPFSHLPGGMLVLPIEGAPWVAASLQD